MCQVSMSYNVDLAKKVGVIASSFISCLDFFIDGSDEKVAISRQTIFNRTGIAVERQEAIEEKLVKVGLISTRKVRGSDDKYYYGIFYDKINGLFNGDEIQLPVETKQTTQKTVKKTKKECITENLKKCVNVEDKEIKEHIFDWIDSVMESGNCLTTQSVKINVEQLLNFSENKKDLIDVLLISTKNSWKDFSWAMDKVKKSSSVDQSGRNFAKYDSIKFENEALSEVVF